MEALVEAHGGSIKIDSEVGKGRKVIVEFDDKYIPIN